jgi:hypothetical protein
MMLLAMNSPIEPTGHNEMNDYLADSADLAHTKLMLFEIENKHSLADIDAKILMSSFLYLYSGYLGDAFCEPEPTTSIEKAVDICSRFRKLLFRHPRMDWNNEEKGLYQLIMAFVYLYKRQYLYSD